jgi:hypothetical protein
MPRPATYPETTGEVLRLELSYLIKQKIIQKGKDCSSTVSWTASHSGKQSSIGIRAFCSTSTPRLELHYQVTKKATGDVRKYDYRVYLETVPSNLGKGEVYYMVCPRSGQRARILYSPDGEDMFVHREAAANRLYYDDQLMAKRFRRYNRYFSVSRKHEQLCSKKYKQYAKEVYAGEPTRWAKRLNAMENELVRLPQLNYF